MNIFTSNRQNENTETQLVNLSERKARALKKSKLLLCCLTKCYLRNLGCTKEFVYAARLHKSICVLLLENNLRISDIQGIEFALRNLQYVKCFEYPDFVNDEKCLHLIKDTILKHFKVGLNFNLFKKNKNQVFNFF